MNLLKARVICLMTIMMTSICAFAQWKQVAQIPTARVVFVTKSGNVLACDFRDDFTGGIMISEDQGETWTQTNADDFNYTLFVEGNGEIYATGSGCILARSTDDGKTWELVDYSDAAAPLAPKGKVEYCQCYGAAILGERLYVADFSCGVFYTDDHGQTWHSTNYQDLSINDGYDTYIEDLYAMAVINNQLLAFGAYRVFCYDEREDRWTAVRGSNFLGVSTVYQGKLVCGRAAIDDGVDKEYLTYTTNGHDWTPIKRPADLISNYVRALTSDNETLYVGMLNYGLYFTKDFGENWYEVTEGLPRRDRINICYDLLALDNDRDYIYAAIFHEDANDTKAGIYRLAKSELGIDGIKSTRPDNDVNIQINHGVLTIDGEFQQAHIIDLSGRTLATTTSNAINLGTLPSGVVICNVTTDSGVRTVKLLNN